jgi:PAS domain S-box-containing protein
MDTARGHAADRRPATAHSSWPSAQARQHLDDLGEAVLAADALGTIVYANRAAEKLLGWAPGRLAGQPATVVVPPSLRPYVPGGASMRAQVEPLVGKPLRVLSSRNDGSELPTEVVLSLAGHEQDQVVIATIRPRAVAHLSRWSKLTATLFDTLGQSDPDISSDAQLLRVLGVQLGFDVTTLWALTPHGTLRCRHVWSDPLADPEGRLRAARSPSPASEVTLPHHVLASGEPLWIPDLSDDPRFSAGPAARAGLTTAVVFPVRYAGCVVGVVELFTKEARRADSGLVDLVRAVSRPVGELLAALEEAAGRERLLRELAEARERQEFVLEAARVVSAASDYHATLRRLAAVAVPSLGDVCLIDVVDEEGNFTRMACHHRDPSKADLVEELERDFPPDPNGRHPAVDVVLRGRSRWSGEMTDDFLRATTGSERHFEIVKALGFESYMTVPLVAGDRVLGTVTLVSAGSGRRFASEDLDWAEQLASQVASVVDRARRHQLELEMSHALQRSLLPEVLPKFPGIELAARYLPATNYAEVGGDWYDVVGDGDHLALVVGDVEGHDLHAATVMAKLRHGLALLLSEGLSPAEAIMRLSRFARHSGIDRLATVLVAVIDRPRQRLVLASAGHYPPVLRVGAHAELATLTPCPPIGVEGKEPREVSVPFTTIDLLLFTDGLVELAAGDLEARLQELVDAVVAGPRTPGGLCGSVLASMVPGAERSDDIAVLAAAVST